MLGLTTSHKFLAFTRIEIRGLYIYVLVVAVAQTCQTSAWVFVVCHTEENYEHEKEAMAAC
jgi:hypothetical protein